MRGFMTLVKRSFLSFGSDRCSTLAASIAYNTVFAIFPMALVGVAVLGFIVGDGSARQRVVDGITKVIPLGSQGADALSNTLKGASNAKGIVGIIGIVNRSMERQRPVRIDPHLTGFGLGRGPPATHAAGQST